MSFILGLDVGGTKIAAGLVHHSSVSKIIKVPTEAKRGKAQVIKNIIKTVHIFDNAKISAIGVSFAGQIDSKKGVVVTSPNLPKNFTNVPMAKIIQKELKKKVFIENDANCFTLAESVYGAGKKYKYVVGLTLGTGIGGGIVVDNTLFTGSRGTAGELGHQIVVENGLKCSCGNPGHLEVYASGTAMARLYKKFTGNTLSPIDVENLAKKGDRNALRVVKIMNETLATGFANIIHTLDPEIIIIGGALAHVKFVWQPAVELAKKMLIYSSLKKIKVVQGRLEKKAHILGAALITQ